DRAWTLARLDFRLADDREIGSGSVTAERDGAHAAHADDTWDSSNVFDHLAMKLTLRRATGIFVARQPILHHQHVFRVEAGINLAQRESALDHQACTRE